MIRIGWFAPPPRVDTPVARFLATALPLLRDRADITVWKARECGDYPDYDGFRVKLYSRQWIPWGEFNQLDVCVFHVVADEADPGYVGELSHHFPGLTVLHGFGIRHLLMQYSRASAIRRWDALLKMVGAGSEATRAARELSRKGEFPEPDTLRTLDVWIARSLGVAVHERALADAMKAQDQWLVRQLPTQPERDPGIWANELLQAAALVATHRERSQKQAFIRKVGVELGAWLVESNHRVPLNVDTVAEAIDYLTTPVESSSPSV